MRETAFALSLPFAPITAYLCPNSQDDDWYSFSVSSYQSVQFFAKAAPATALFNASVDGDSGLYCQFWNPRGDQMLLAVFQFVNTTLDLMPGTYYLRFTTEPGAAYPPATPPSVYSFSIQPVIHTCVPSGPASNLTSPYPLGNGTNPTIGRFCPVDAEFYLYFDVTAAVPLQDYSFVLPGQDPPQAALYRDGTFYGDLTPRQIPGAAGGFYGTDRSILPPGRYVIRLRGAGFYTYTDDSRPEEWKQWQ